MRELSEGDRLDQYTLRELISRGGMASIFKATDLESGETVALKVPHEKYEGDVVFFGRFLREEAVGQRLDHPGIVKVLRPRDKSRVYLAMEHVEGRSLRTLLQAGLSPQQALEIARQICASLEYMHGHGVIHRDLKPENLLLTHAGQVKIVDFGLALDRAGRRLTWSGLSSSVGTPDYVAPEQIQGKRGDARSDLYAVGTILFEMLTGHLPFSGLSIAAVLRAKLEDDPLPPRRFLPAIDPALEGVILRAIARSPRDRYGNAADLLRDLEDPPAAHPLGGGGGTGRLRGRAVAPLAVAALLAGLASLAWLGSRARLAQGRTPATAQERRPPR
jgi:eukaryotic-like serine/threonine-protein kinase